MTLSGDVALAQGVDVYLAHMRRVLARLNSGPKETRVRDWLFIATPEPGEPPPDPPAPSAAQILQEVCEKYDVALAELRGSRKHAYIAKARVEAVLRLARELPHWSTPRIGRAINRDHSTVIHTLKRHGGRGTRTAPTSEGRVAE
jgi:hypothetical protein